MERLTPLATAFLAAEETDPQASLVIGSMAVFAGPAPRFEDFRDMVAGRLPLIPRYRQKLSPAPLGLAAPAWIDDPDFSLGWHLRNTALPSPGGRAEIGRLIGRVMSRRMDRRRPLWEYWFVEGLAGERWALLSKLHHCMVDGVSGTDLYRLILDRDGATSVSAETPWVPDPPPARLSAATAAVTALAGSPINGIRAIGGALRTPSRSVRRGLEVGRGLLTMSQALWPLQPTSLTGPLGGSLRYVWSTASLTEIRVVRQALGGTVNDVALAAIAGGFRRLLLARGEDPGPHALRSLVPVSTRAPGTESELGNQVSLMLPYLPVEVADAGERLAAVRSRVHERVVGGEPVAGAELTDLAELGLFPLVALGIRTGLRLPQHQIATVTTNVPGPRETFSALGRELQEILPYVPIADQVRIGVAIFSYRDTLTFGITADYDAAPDIQVLADGITLAMRELSELAAST